jgi:hypothetical protein
MDALGNPFGDVLDKMNHVKLLFACLTGDTSKLRTALLGEIHEKQPLLLTACQGGRKEIVELLLAAGADKDCVIYIDTLYNNFSTIDYLQYITNNLLFIIFIITISLSRR